MNTSGILCRRFPSFEIAIEEYAAEGMKTADQVKAMVTPAIDRIKAQHAVMDAKNAA